VQRHFVMAELLAGMAYFEARDVLQRNRRPDGVFVWSARWEGAEELRP
jgi:hypothetical protein